MRASVLNKKNDLLVVSVERVMGLEPILRPWKGLVLPLHHTRLCEPL